MVSVIMGADEYILEDYIWNVVKLIVRFKLKATLCLQHLCVLNTSRLYIC